VALTVKLIPGNGGGYSDSFPPASSASPGSKEQKTTTCLALLEDGDDQFLAVSCTSHCRSPHLSCLAAGEL